MSLMGYTADNVEDWQGTLLNVIYSKSCNDKQREVLKELSDFLDGLLVEGRV